jgi:8-oxo-dGTP pyrophosphatase MutT (NUDIX family)
LLVNDKNQVLLQDRKGISKYGEEWSFFWGGIEEWESSEQALKRELSEELDWLPSEYSFLGETKHEMKERDVLYHRYVYLVKIPHWVEWSDREGAWAFLFTIDEIKNLKFNTPIEPELKLLYDNILISQ